MAEKISTKIGLMKMPFSDCIYLSLDDLLIHFMTMGECQIDAKAVAGELKRMKEENSK